MTAINITKVSVEKRYDPSQPRAPKGSPDGGQWVEDVQATRSKKPRKQHSDEAGYIAERMNPYVPGKKVAIYLAEAQGFDVAGMKYAVVCWAHGTLNGATNMPDARVQMKWPENFCEECQSLADLVN